LGATTKRRAPRADAAKGRTERAAVRTAGRIAEEIRRKKLRPGAKLDPEHRMVAKLGVSRATVREALRFLELQGALQIKAGPGGGPVVSVPGPEHMASVLSLQLQFADTSFRGLLEARKAIYPVLAGEAAENATNLQILALQRTVEKMRAKVEDWDALVHEFRHFQELVADASGNTVLGLLVSALHRMSERVNVEFDEKQRRSALPATENILRAIERGEAEQARVATEQMVGAALRYMERTCPDALEAPIAWRDSRG
jgi:GntR family transcriptional repressor for pyruvate dehydrogenase complex